LEKKTKPKAQPESQILHRKWGAFVTLHKAGQLRGCIGYVAPIYPLYEAVIECTVAAATQDPRFPPVTLEELPQIDVEISALSPMEEVENISTIEVGVHGLVISQHGRRGLLLPQVAVEYGWDCERFVRETCRKAGLSPDAWQQGAKIEKFSAMVFGELERQSPPSA
jgi:AmmeMemoRadiSam system protein A